jgi:hypothetical protein
LVARLGAAAYHRSEAHEVVNLNGYVKPREIVETALALFMLLQDQLGAREVPADGAARGLQLR